MVAKGLVRRGPLPATRFCSGFSHALQILKDDQGIVTREGWPANRFVFLGRVNNIVTPPSMPASKVTTRAAFCVADGDIVTCGWLPSLEDLLAEDWFELRPAGG